MRALLLFTLALAGCEPSVSFDSGEDAALRVADGTFRREAFPADEGGPEVLAAYLGRTELRVGEQDKSFSGVLDSGAKALAVMLEGDRGFWVVAAGFPLPESPDQPSFGAPLSFATDVPLGPSALLLAASDDRGAYGGTLRVPVTFVRGATPTGALAISLGWDTASDLDLHVVMPSGVEIDNRNPSSATPTQRDNPGVLDFDSNADCALDRRNLESITWQASPPSGRYLVRVDTPSLCDETIARWFVEVRLHGERLGAAEGTSTEAATRARHGRGAGVLALTFDVP